MRWHLTPLIVVALLAFDLATLAYSVLEGPFPITVTLGTPMAYKNIYIHVPIALSTYILFAGAAASALLYILRGGGYLAYTDTFIAIGIIYAAATLATGIAWASESWGAPWNWDPKQTAVLLLAIAYAAYFPLKRSIADPDRRSRVAAAYALAAFSMVPISYLSSRVLESLHPTTEAVAEFTQGGAGGVLLIVRIVIVAALTLTIAIAAARGSLRLSTGIPLLYLAISITAAIALFWGSVGGGERVLTAEVDSGGRIVSITLASGDKIVFNEPVENPINPPLTPEGGSSIVSHIVRVENGSLKVLYHWSTPFSYLAHTIIISLSLAYGIRRGSRA
ncbi:MAG: cytochrome c biogenesis protein [Desulfurococcales archaeon]|nr:cytochrome c biogenesis protein [Desulfurococcales archaeon]